MKRCIAFDKLKKEITFFERKTKALMILVLCLKFNTNKAPMPTCFTRKNNTGECQTLERRVWVCTGEMALPSFPPPYDESAKTFFSSFLLDFFLMTGDFFNTASRADMTKDEKKFLFFGGEERDEEKVKVFPSPFRGKEGGQSFFWLP